MKKEVDLQLEVRRVRKVDLDKVGGGYRVTTANERTTTECQYALTTGS